MVNIKDQYGDWEAALAVSAGGMDLSWDVCEAYLLLGYLPPLNFYHLHRIH